MADKKTLREISSDLVQLNSAVDMPELDEDDRKDIQEIINSLTTRQASKIDCTIGVLKSFDLTIENCDKEIKLLVSNATDFALESPLPDNKELYTDVYVE